MDNRIKLIHPEKPGVIARVGQGQLQAHLDDKWELFVEKEVVKNDIIIEEKPKRTRRKKVM